MSAANNERPALQGAQPMVDLQKLLADVYDNALTDFVQLSAEQGLGDSDR